MLNESERELILICARQRVPAALLERAAKIVDANVRWDELIATAWRHGVAPLLFRHLEALGPDCVPQRATHLLRQAYVRAAFRNQAHYRAIADMLQRFAAAGIDIMLLKGAALAQAVYDDPALRPFADIDVLVREKDLDAAKESLSAGGYRLSPDLLSEGFNRRYHNNLPFVLMGERPVHVELHWKLADSFSGITFDHDALFARGTNVAATGSGFTLSAEDQLLYLAVHLDNHGYLNRSMLEHDTAAAFALDNLSGNRLIWFTDLHELVVARDLDWAAIRERAEAAQAAGALAITLRLLRVVLGTPMDPQVLSDLPLPNASWPKRILANYVFRLAADGKSGSRARQLFRSHLLATRRGFELRLVRLLDLWKYFFPTRTRMDRLLPYATRACGAISRCVGMAAELQFLRASRFVKKRIA